MPQFRGVAIVATTGPLYNRRDPLGEDVAMVDSFVSYAIARLGRYPR